MSRFIEVVGRDHEKAIINTSCLYEVKRETDDLAAVYISFGHWASIFYVRGSYADVCRKIGGKNFISEKKLYKLLESFTNYDGRQLKNIGCVASLRESEDGIVLQGLVDNEFITYDLDERFSSLLEQLRGKKK